MGYITHGSWAISIPHLCLISKPPCSKHIKNLDEAKLDNNTINIKNGISVLFKVQKWPSRIRIKEYFNELFYFWKKSRISLPFQNGGWSVANPNLILRVDPPVAQISLKPHKNENNGSLPALILSLHWEKTAASQFIEVMRNSSLM